MLHVLKIPIAWEIMYVDSILSANHAYFRKQIMLLASVSRANAKMTSNASMGMFVENGMKQVH